MQYTSKNEAQTQEIATNMAADLRPGTVLCLRGGLGTGKTVFARALIRALAKNETLEVPSPTFTLVQTYETPKGSVWHFDLYRLEDEEEIHELGWDDARAEGIVIVEWPERLGSFLPKNRADIAFAPLADDTNQREITVTLHKGSR